MSRAFVRGLGAMPPSLQSGLSRTYPLFALKRKSLCA